MKFIKDNCLAIIATYLNVIIGVYIVKSSFGIEELNLWYTISALIIFTLSLKLFDYVNRMYDKKKQMLIYLFFISGIIIIGILFNLINTGDINIQFIYCIILIGVGYSLLIYKLIKLEGGEVLININILFITLLIMENLEINFVIILILVFNLFFTIFISNYEGIKKKYLIKTDVNLKGKKVVYRGVAFIMIIATILNFVPLRNNSLLYYINLNQRQRSNEKEDEVKIKGPITLSSKELYRMVGLPYPNTKYYFKKKVLDFYSGQSWKKSEENFQDFNLKLISENYLNKDKLEISIEPIENYNNKYLSIDYPTGIFSRYKILYSDDTNEFQSNEDIKNSYTIQYIDSQKYNNDLLKTNKILKDNNIESKYTQVPENISDKVVQLVKEIIKDCKSDYEKAESIKKYLSTGYKYTLTPTERNENEDFLEYFLLKEKQGYCVYYATAMTIMCRIAGVPARYVEGYSIKNEYNSEEVIKESDGHAWAEVMYTVPTRNGNEKIWYVYDPTPAVESTNINDNINAGETTESVNVDKNETNEYVNNNVDINTDIKKDNKKLVMSNIKISIIFAFLLTIRVIYLYIKRIRIIKGKNIEFYLYVLKRLKKINIFKHKNESDSSFLNRIEDDELQEHLRKIIDAVHKEYFGNYKDVKIEKKLEIIYIEDYIKMKQGTMKYWIKVII